MSLSHCTQCGFEFFSMHKPYSTTDNQEFGGAFSVLCTGCLSSFTVPTKSPWGVTSLEELELCTLHFYELNSGPTKKRTRSKYIGTGIKLIASAVETPYQSMVDFRHLPCPECTKTNYLTAHLGVSTCPKCKCAQLKEEIFE